MVSVQGLDKRYYYGGYGTGYGYHRSRFYSWGRWVLLGIIIFAALIFLLACTCFARRRRRKGTKPVYGTGWMAPTGGKWGVNNNNNQYPMNNTGYNQGGYGQDYNQNQGGYNQGYNQGGYNAPPAYGQPQQQQQYDGYYGGQQYNGVQQPPNTYNRDAPLGDVAPPPGPPPGK